jgi:hypothetical protein
LTLESLVATDVETQKYGYRLVEDLDILRQRATTCEVCRLVEERINVLPLPSSTVKKDAAVWASGISTTDPPTTPSLTGVIFACNGRSATLNIYGNPPLEK